MSANIISSCPEGPGDRFIEFVEFDDFDENLYDDEEDEDDEELSVEFLIDHSRSRLGHAYTKGLWEYGIPELYVKVPEDFDQGDTLDGGQLALFLGTGLVHLGLELMAVDHFSIPPYQGEFNGKPARMWLDHQEPAEHPITIALGDYVDTVVRVDCSLWHPSLLGDG